MEMTGPNAGGYCPQRRTAIYYQTAETFTLNAQVSHLQHAVAQNTGHNVGRDCQWVTHPKVLVVVVVHVVKAVGHRRQHGRAVQAATPRTTKGLFKAQTTHVAVPSTNGTHPRRHHHARTRPKILQPHISRSYPLRAVKPLGLHTITKNISN